MFGLFEVFIFFCVICYLFNKARAKDMVDVITNHVQDVIGSIRIPRFPNTGGSNHEERITAPGLRRFANDKQKQKNILRDKEKQAIEKSLYQLKETQTPALSLPIKPLQGLTCQHCAPSNSERQLGPLDKCRDVIDILRVTKYSGWRPDSSIFDWSGWFPFLAQCMKLKRYPFTQVSGTVLKDERLRHAIEHSIAAEINEKKKQLQADGVNVEEFDEDEYYEQLLKENNNRAKRILLDMRSKISDTLLRFTSWVLYKLLPCFLSGVVAHPAHIDMLKAATVKAPGVPLIFVPLHRSHLDYILVSFILLNNDIRAPIVAAGDNLRIPFFGALLRGLGAFFIKRKIDPIAGKKDIVYRSVLHTYMQHALAAGHNIEFFIEGGRTRTGKPCMPKSGVLSVIIDAFMDGTISDALLVPMSVNYERLVDGNFVYEQLGQKKKPESFRSAISAIWQILNSKYGLMRIDFNEPFSLRELVKSLNKSTTNSDITERTQNILKQYGNTSSIKRLQHQPSTSSLFGTDIVQEEHRTLVDNIARHVVVDCSSATAVMTTNALAFLLLTRFRDGATMNILVEALDELRSSLQGVKNIGFTGDSKDVILYAANLLGSELISIEKRGEQLFFKPITSVSNVIELYYYANSLVSHYALDSVIITTLHNLSKIHEKNYPNSQFKVSKSELFKLCIEHCDTLRYEFLWNKPCQSIEDVLEESLEQLKSKELVSIPSETYTEDQLWSRRRAQEFDDSDNEDDAYVMHKTENDVANISLPSEGHCNRLILMSVIEPYSHTYLAVGNSLYTLLNNCMLETEFIKVCVKEITSKVDNLECKYGESISTDTIRNCMKMLEKLTVIEITNTSGVRMVSLGRTFDSSDGVRNIIERMQALIPIH